LIGEVLVSNKYGVINLNANMMFNKTFDKCYEAAGSRALPPKKYRPHADAAVSGIPEKVAASPALTA
jgi:hypothetical protein